MVRYFFSELCGGFGLGFGQGRAGTLQIGRIEWGRGRHFELFQRARGYEALDHAARYPGFPREVCRRQCRAILEKRQDTLARRCHAKFIVRFGLAVDDHRFWRFESIG